MRVFDPNKVPKPPDWKPWPKVPYLDIEIGCGVGFHAIRRAIDFPERHLVAIERTSDKFGKFRRRIDRHPSLPNLTALQGDAIAWISHGLSVESVDRYFILYPNPYPKESQRNLRFHEMPFFPYLVKTLKPGGQITLATNEMFYLDPFGKRCESLGLRSVSVEVVGGPGRTHFEKKYLQRGLTCWNAIFSRK